MFFKRSPQKGRKNTVFLQKNIVFTGFIEAKREKSRLDKRAEKYKEMCHNEIVPRESPLK